MAPQTSFAPHGLLLSLLWFANPCVIPCEVAVLHFFFLLRDCCALLLLKNHFDTCGWLSLLSSKSGTMPPPKHGSVRVDHRRAVHTNSLFRDIYDDSEEEDDEVGYADPVQDDLYARKMGIKSQPVSSVSYDKFLPKFWTPEEDVHVEAIKQGSQRRPWYKKMQGFRCVRAFVAFDPNIYFFLSNKSKQICLFTNM